MQLFTSFRHISAFSEKRNISTTSFIESLSPRGSRFSSWFITSIYESRLYLRKRVKSVRYMRCTSASLENGSVCMCIFTRLTHIRTYIYIYMRLARLGCIRGRRLRIHHDECYLILCHCPPWAFCSSLPPCGPCFLETSCRN